VEDVVSGKHHGRASSGELSEDELEVVVGGLARLLVAPWTCEMEDVELECATTESS
jgi:hypothetical protein